MTTTPPTHAASLLRPEDVYLFNEGTHARLYERLGAHPAEVDGTPGFTFAVWAPNARSVGLIGDVNGWDPKASPLRARESSGIWEGFVPGVKPGDRYKFAIASRHRGYRVAKADPLAFRSEPPPATASIIWDLAYDWGDTEWMSSRRSRSSLDAPIATYEVHLGSWMRTPGGIPLSYRDLAPRLAEHVTRTGFTHVELMPVMEHPFYGSWGYQVTGYFSPTARYGTPQDLMYLIDVLHQHGIGVILDWVPSHFPDDEHGLGYFDGTHLYEHEDPRRGRHPDWQSLIFNYGRNEVRSFLLSSAMFWLTEYHADGLRFDAVASMLYLDYSRREGEWIPNEHGGRENLEAISFLRQLNETVYRLEPDVQTIAEESTSWPLVSRPTDVGGLGFGLKWDMGWMHDTLRYLSRDPIDRKSHHGDLTFRQFYAGAENFVLPLSHDEVVHGKGSLLEKMPGDEWQRFANLRLLFGYQYALAGKKLLFMGNEFGQRREWAHERSLDWHLLEQPEHAGVLRWVQDLNRIYRDEPALHEKDADPAGFEWMEPDDASISIVAFIRTGLTSDDIILVACNFTPVPRSNYRLGVPRGGPWREILNSDAHTYGGSGWGNLGGLETAPTLSHGRKLSVALTLPPLACVFLKNVAA